MRLTRKTCSKHFRDQVGQTYPGLHKNPAYWALMEYLHYGCRYDEVTGRLRIPQETLAKMEGKESLLDSCHYKAESFLEGFQKDVMSPETFQWSGWNNQAGYCRVITKCDFTYDHNLLRIDELQKRWHKKGRVYFRDGRKFSRASQIKERQMIEAEALKSLEKAGCEEARVLLEYLNNLPPNLFTKMLVHIDEARLVACKLSSEQKRNHALNILDSIEDQSKPFYQPSGPGRTVRVFSLNESLLLLPSAVRDVLTQDWVSFDLRSSQLAICAFTWNVPLAKEFLQSGGNVWESLFNHLGLDYDLRNTNEVLYKELKDPLKKALYSTMYGMEKSDISRNLTNALKPYGVESAGRLFCDHPFFAALLQARDEQIKTIKRQGGAFDCFGKIIHLSNDVDAKSILAQIAQALELYILFPAVEMATRSLDDFKIVLWLHDGFSVKFIRSSQSSIWMKKIQVAVQDRAVVLGIPTVLEVH